MGQQNTAVIREPNHSNNTNNTCDFLQSFSNFERIPAFPSMSFTRDSGILLTAECESNVEVDLPMLSAMSPDREEPFTLCEDVPADDEDGIESLEDSNRLLGDSNNLIDRTIVHAINNIIACPIIFEIFFAELFSIGLQIITIKTTHINTIEIVVLQCFLSKIQKCVIMTQKGKENETSTTLFLNINVQCAQTYNSNTEISVRTISKQGNVTAVGIGDFDASCIGIQSVCNFSPTLRI